ncbi:uncharacterized protein N7473_003493 [Penicillium subrubescens]|uniref:Uncharacterized protein n=1 Tax=Penicillium subrubescens TaxID=1316194 RepID=A0A1Q5TI04_9EURO|nr:uncharacterized protein N7473_003493 [Penicillium subrubescens]KAJ5906577.1 hypothetical protein N7473_003493 [Penicillium subrubescens]OKO99857.1 hypothetical protein PENSUB_8074 [Penicillium subrubescens]
MMHAFERRNILDEFPPFTSTAAGITRQTRKVEGHMILQSSLLKTCHWQYLQEDACEISRRGFSKGAEMGTMK